MNFWNTIFFLIKEKPNVANIFITSGIAIIRDILFLKLLHKNNIPTIIHFHSKTKGEFALKHSRLKIAGKLFDKYTNKIILLTEAHLQDFQTFFNKEKCVVVEKFVNYKEFECDIEKNRNDFLFVGSLNKQKGFYNLLEAIELLKKQMFKFKIIC